MLVNSQISKSTSICTPQMLVFVGETEKY